MKALILLMIVLAFVNVDAKKKNSKNKHGLATTKHKITEPFRMPVFAIRMPIFGAQAMVRPSSLDLNDAADAAVPKEKLNTVTKSSNSTKGPYKTFTVVTETKSANKSNPHVYSKIIKSVTTMNSNSTNGKKLPNLRMTRIRIFNPFGKIFGGMGLGNEKLDDEEENEQDCSEKQPCKSNDQFCDAFYGTCKNKVVPYGACTQTDQCSKNKGTYECTWGRCVKGDPGSAGTFCDKHSDCHTHEANEDLGCFTQNDISRFAKVCIPKLGEGGTCGRSTGIFGMFENEEDDRCQGNLVCRAVGFFGRKACIRDISKEEHKYIAAIKKSKKLTKHRKLH